MLIDFTKSLFLWEVPKYTRVGLYTQILTAMLLYVSWIFLPLIPGLAIAGLGFVAVVMTVRADKFPICERVVWVMLGFFLLTAEVRTLYLDRIANEAQQHAEREEQQKRFSETLDGFSRVITQNQREFETTLRQMKRLDQSADRRFSALVSHQEQLAEAQTGVLTPADQRLREGPCGGPPGSISVFLGNPEQNIIANTSRFPHVIIKSKTQGNVLAIDKNSDGSIAVIFDLRTKDGKIIARMNRDGFVINRNNTLEIRKSRSKLSVVDLFGVEVLIVDYLNPNAINIKSVDLPSFKGSSRLCLGGNATDIIIK